MTKKFTFSYSKLAKNNNGQYDHYETITLTKTVTDKMESRDFFKKVYAANWFQNKIRKEYWNKFVVHANNVKEL